MARPHPRIPELLANGSATSRADLARLLNVAPSTASTWVVQVAEVGVEVVEGLVSGGYTSLHEQQADDWVKPQRGGQCVSEVYLLFRLGSDVPSVCHYLLWFCFLSYL